MFAAPSTRGRAALVRRVALVSGLSLVAVACSGDDDTVTEPDPVGSVADGDGAEDTASEATSAATTATDGTPGTDAPATIGGW